MTAQEVHAAALTWVQAAVEYERTTHQPGRDARAALNFIEATR